MQIQELDITIQPDGSVKIQVIGVKGPQCLDLTADIEAILGGQILSREKTCDFDEPETQTLNSQLSTLN